ncbi:adenylyltransferase/cytidyltransferase family protein [Patescibacteria group bacterium]|nr:adenylyltransferase/cytidyltransferase family protein [Patescibacteria group bacterium]
MLEKKNKTRIMVFGTFDGLHKGHLNFFAQAKSLVKKSFHEPFLIVSIARDVNVLKIKGEYPKLNEKKRLILIKKNKIVDKVVLSGTKNHLPHVIKEKPDVIALGYDQYAYVKNLKKDLKNKGILVKIVRLKPYKEYIYKNSLLRKKI